MTINRDWDTAADNHVDHSHHASGNSAGQPDTGHSSHSGPGAMSHGGHGWMMIACCIPMLAIAIALVATGVVGFGFIFIALMCTAMMFMMHKAMGGMGHDT